jgi:hypothetical protein
LTITRWWQAGIMLSPDAPYGCSAAAQLGGGGGGDADDVDGDAAAAAPRTFEWRFPEQRTLVLPSPGH